MIELAAGEQCPGRRCVGEHPQRPAFDAFRIFCDRLAEGGGDRPNLGVVHLTVASDREHLSQAYADAEGKAGVRDLPLIVLSPKGDLGVKESVMSNRHHQLLPTPLTVSRLLEAIDRALAAQRRGVAA